MMTSQSVLIRALWSITGRERFPYRLTVQSQRRSHPERDISYGCFAEMQIRTLEPSRKRYCIVFLMELRSHRGAGIKIENWWRTISLHCGCRGFIVIVLINFPSEISCLPHSSAKNVVRSNSLRNPNIFSCLINWPSKQQLIIYPYYRVTRNLQIPPSIPRGLRTSH